MSECSVYLQTCTGWRETRSARTRRTRCTATSRRRCSRTTSRPRRCRSTRSCSGPPARRPRCRRRPPRRTPRSAARRAAPLACFRRVPIVVAVPHHVDRCDFWRACTETVHCAKTCARQLVYCEIILTLRYTNGALAKGQQYHSNVSE